MYVEADMRMRKCISSFRVVEGLGMCMRVCMDVCMYSLYMCSYDPSLVSKLL